VHLLALHVPVEDERPGADHVGPAGLEVLRLLQRPGRDLTGVRRGEEVEEERVRLLQRELDGVRPGHLGRLELGELDRGDRRVVAGLDELVEVRLDRVRVEPLAVVEGDVVAQLEGVDAAVRGHLPRLGQPGDELAVGVPRDERVELVEHQQPGLVLAPLVRVEGERLGLDRPGEPVAAGGRRGRAAAARRAAGARREGEGDQ